jgi:C-terminal processing protease CtpA/Prc
MDALVLDLRDNHGGGGDTLPGLLTCFFPRGGRLELARKSWRPTNEVTSIGTLPELEGPRFPEGPVVILTSEDTRSAAEALAYHLRAFGRAMVVGERSSGGAHPADMVSLGDGFVALIPMGVVTSTRTGTDWEGRGVPLDEPCSAEDAEAQGHRLALRLLDVKR